MGGICPCFKKTHDSDETDERSRLLNPNSSVNGPSRPTGTLGPRTISERTTRAEPTPVTRVQPTLAENASVPYNNANSIPQQPPVEESDPFQRIIHNAEQAIIDMASMGATENNQQDFERRLRLYQDRLRAPETARRIQSCLTELNASGYPKWPAPRPAAPLDTVSAERARTLAKWSVEANTLAAVAEVRTPSGQRLIEPFTV